MNKKISKKTSVNVAVGLVKAYSKSGSSMKKAVLSIGPSALEDTTLRNLFKKYKIVIPREIQNLRQKKEYFDELSTLLFPNPSDRSNTEKVSLHLREEEKNTIMSLSGEDVFSSAFRRLLLLHYAMQQQQNIKQVEQNIAGYYNKVVIPQACMPKASGITTDTGLYVLGNKKWFLGEFREILKAVPDSVKTFVEPFMGSGIVALEACNRGCFRRIITNDIYWHKVNYLRAFFFRSDALKAACLSLKPDQATYDEANKVIEKYRNSSTDEILPDVAAKYLFINYCNKSRGGLNKKNILEGNEGAIEKYMKYLDCLWNFQCLAKKVIIHNEDALDIIKRYNRKKHLLFVDPPYPKTKGYETDFSIEDFENIVKATIDFNGHFIFCCRITDKHEKVYSHNGAYGIEDLRIKHIIDSSFSDNGLYYHDYLFNKSGVAIERVITNFPFTGCYLYDTEEPWQGE